MPENWAPGDMNEWQMKDDLLHLICSERLKDRYRVVRMHEDFPVKPLRGVITCCNKL